MTGNVKQMHPALLSPELETVVDMLDQAATRYPDRIAIISNEDQITYRDYRNCIAGMAAELINLGAKGECVAMMNPNSIVSP